MQRRSRLVIITPIVTPYRTPVFDALARREDLDLTVLYLAITESQRRWTANLSVLKHPFVVMPEFFRIERRDVWTHVSRGVFRRLRSLKPDVVIAGGWDQPATMAAFFLRRLLHFRFVWWVESTTRDARAKNSLNDRVKRFLIRSADGVVVPGTAAKRYVIALGASEDRVFLAPNVVDDRFFSPGPRSEHRGPTRFLYVGRLDPSKGLDVLLDAWKGCPSCGSLTLVGDGTLRDHLGERIKREGITSVSLKGHLDGLELGEAYREADVLVLPSLTDVWGLVVNEAMLTGLPVIVSDVVGAIDDLVEDGGNGVIVPAGNAEALCGAMTSLARDGARLTVMGRRSMELIHGFTPEQSAQGFVEVVSSVTAPRAT